MIEELKYRCDDEQSGSISSWKTWFSDTQSRRPVENYHMEGIGRSFQLPEITKVPNKPLVKIHVVHLQSEPKKQTSEFLEVAVTDALVSSGLEIIKSRMLATEGRDFSHIENFQKAGLEVHLRALQVLTGAAVIIGSEFPKATVSSTGEGGLRFEWLRRERDVRLVIADSEAASYLFYRDDANSDITDQVTATNLANKLRLVLEVW